MKNEFSPGRIYFQIYSLPPTGAVIMLTHLTALSGLHSKARFLKIETLLALLYDIKLFTFNYSLLSINYIYYIEVYIIMGEKGLDFKHKEVININDGKRLGYVQDVTADLQTGIITSIIVPGTNKMFNIFGGNNEIVIPWEKIKCIGDDIILVEI